MILLSATASAICLATILAVAGYVLLRKSLRNLSDNVVGKTFRGQVAQLNSAVKKKSKFTLLEPLDFYLNYFNFRNALERSTTLIRLLNEGERQE